MVTTATNRGFKVDRQLKATVNRLALTRALDELPAGCPEPIA